jgi:asparagine synthase (glutamine-hydrolysing)
MCGICGVYQERPSDPALLGAATARMTEALAHRGPDDGGVWADPAGRVALGNRRLAIIDLSPAGHQPMADPTSQVVLTYNGEIYNFRELRRELERSGYPFRSHTDTEVILALYLREGPEMCRYLRGMFALALWDGRTRRLVLARDRLGIKPLYYAHRDGRWVFASEIRAIRASGLLSMPVDPVGLAAFLRLGSVPGPLTAFEGVRELPPASLLVVGNEGAGVSRPYWEVPLPDEGPRPRSATASVEELRRLLHDAVARHLVSDVPLGVFLSGGVDSGAIVAMMREAGHERIRTFSVTFPEAEFDEGTDAARVAERHGTEHTAAEVRGEDVARELDRVVAAMDQPTIDGVNTYYVSRVTRASGTIVALSGLGGDELFGGYPSFRQIPRLLAWQRATALLGSARTILGAALAVVPSPRSAKLRESLTQPPTIQSAYLAVRGLLSREEVTSLLRPGPLRDAARELDAAMALSALAPALPEDPVAATGVLELRGYLHNQLLRDTDAMSMAHSLEVRVPFLDHPLVEFAAALPGWLRANGRPPKWLLLDALGERLPEDVGRPKRGFTFPLGRWIRGPLRPRVEEALQDGRGIFRPEAVAELRAQVEAGRAHWSRLWAPVVLARWLRQVGETGDLA